MKTAIYVRLAKGAPDTASAQEYFLCAFAKNNLMEVSRIYRDIGFTGDSDDRPGLRAMLHDAQTGSFRAVLIKDMGRLARDSSLAVDILGHFTRNGVEVRTPEGIVTAIGIRHLLEHMKENGATGQ